MNREDVLFRRAVIALVFCITFCMVGSTLYVSKVKSAQMRARMEDYQSKLLIVSGERDNATEAARQWRDMYQESLSEIAQLKAENEELTRRWEEVSFAYDEVCEETGWTCSGEFRIYHYCPCVYCCGKEQGEAGYGITATGTTATAGRTIAVDPSVIPLGSKVLINGVVYVAEDTGGDIVGNRIDLFVTDHAQAAAMGTYTTTVRWR